MYNYTAKYTMADGTTFVTKTTNTCLSFSDYIDALINRDFTTHVKDGRATIVNNKHVAFVEVTEN